MDARERLRVYLEQRRELGERELVLDEMSVDEVLKIVGAGSLGALTPRTTQSRGPRAASEMEAPAPGDSPAVVRGDWRGVLGQDSAPPAPPAPPVAPVAPVTERPREPRATPSEPDTPPRGEPREASRETGTRLRPGAVPASARVDAPTGIIVGTSDRALFGGKLDEVATLDGIAVLARACTACGLHALAKNAVPGSGDPNADFVCVGEAPGQTEDETGFPFVGRAGDLLDKILGAIDLSRDKVFICNVIKHRPPGNRNPTPDEVTACSPYLRRQLELLKPKVILALGAFAAQTLLDTKTPITKLRGVVHRYYGVPLIATYHPAALLRNPAWKRPTWEDVQLARRILDRATGA